MHLDKKLIAIIVSSSLVGGVIGGGIGGAIGSFSGHEGGHRNRGNNKQMERSKGYDNYSDSETNDDNSKTPQEGEKITNTTQSQTQAVSASTTKAK